MEEEMCPPLPLSLSSTTEVEDFSLNFASMYHSIFPPLLSSSSVPSSLSFTPSPSSADDDHNHHSTTVATSTTDDLLFQARLILQHRHLRHRHDLCLRRLHQVAEDADYLRRENAQLRLANAELVKVISSKSVVDDLISIPNSHLRSLIGGDQSGEEIGYDIISPTSVIGKYNDQFDGRNNLGRISLPKSISVRSPAAASVSIQSRPARTPVSDGGSRKREVEATEWEVYNQGMTKTELCNKWQETGGCPYGDRCRFAHGPEELRPVMRHPRYKTQMCRMVLAREKCPYGHRCHFRHSLSEQ
ncbi:zinc finger CCCH domain-containing protein 14-like [Benincasa hispida]|uniref:zinc finger CCCH domain-containing protein 14-like n=1 Tax=Benincasa hispida TaxID=102211 RepID=UPI0019007241|nr:zinc finger CCCH domain-containing protein 14-like [Benincasa hispida]